MARQQAEGRPPERSLPACAPPGGCGAIYRRCIAAMPASAATSSPARHCRHEPAGHRLHSARCSRSASRSSGSRQHASRFDSERNRVLRCSIIRPNFSMRRVGATPPGCVSWSPVEAPVTRKSSSPTRTTKHSPPAGRPARGSLPSTLRPLCDLFATLATFCEQAGMTTILTLRSRTESMSNWLTP